MRLSEYLELKKNKWTQTHMKDLSKASKAKLWFMYNKSYRKEGFQKLGSTNFNDFTKRHGLLWLINIDDGGGDPEPDAFISYRKEKYGNKKIILLSSDMESISKHMLMKKLVALLKTSGWFMEASGRVEDILLKNGLKYIDDEETVKKILYPGIIWLGDGRYERTLKGTSMILRDRIFGRPKGI